MSLGKTPHVLCGAPGSAGQRAAAAALGAAAKPHQRCDKHGRRIHNSLTKLFRGSARRRIWPVLPLLLLLTHLRQYTSSADPEGVAHGDVFRPSHGWRVGKPPRTALSELALSGKAAFFAYFLCGGKESKSPKAKALGENKVTGSPLSRDQAKATAEPLNPPLISPPPPTGAAPATVAATARTPAAAPAGSPAVRRSRVRAASPAAPRFPRPRRRCADPAGGPGR